MQKQHGKVGIKTATRASKYPVSPARERWASDVIVDLLHANMAIYYAYIDRAPVFIVGATGPMDETKRRPRIDWIHTAQGQGEAVRQYTKRPIAKVKSGQPALLDTITRSR